MTTHALERSDASEKPALVCWYELGAAPKWLEALETHWHQWDAVAYHRVSNLEKLTEILRNSPGVVVFAFFQTSGGFATLAQWAQSSKVALTGYPYRLLAFTSIDNPKVQSLLKARGVHEVGMVPASPRALQIKLEKNVEVCLRSMHQSEKAAASSGATIGSISARAASKPTLEPKVEWKTALASPADYWWVHDKKKIKCVRSVWMLEVTGPGPSLGKWEGNGNEWQWIPRGGEPLRWEPGRWVFEGRCPEFDWKLGWWRFVGQGATLSFRKGSETPWVRWRGRDDLVLEIAENSEAAQKSLEWIRASIEASIRIQSEKKPAGGPDHRFAEDEGPVWNPGTTKPEHFSGGLGLGSQDGTKHYGYQKEEVATGAAAFEKRALEATVQLARTRFPAQVLEVNEKTLIVETAPNAGLTELVGVGLELRLIRGSNEEVILIMATIVRAQQIDERSLELELSAPPEGRKMAQALLDKVAGRQEEADDFLLAAKGY